MAAEKEDLLGHHDPVTQEVCAMKWNWNLQGKQATFKVVQDLGQRDGYDDRAHLAVAIMGQLLTFLVTPAMSRTTSEQTPHFQPGAQEKGLLSIVYSSMRSITAVSSN
jgi:hypothetical protein